MTINIGIAEKTRCEISHQLKHLLADTYTLYLKTHNYHWNVTGPQFLTLHTLFEEQYTELATAVDQIAERIRTLGDYAPASYSAFSELTDITQDVDQPNAESMIKRLTEANETVVRCARAQMASASDGSDEATIDLLTQRISIHEKNAWFLRSLQSNQG